MGNYIVKHYNFFIKVNWILSVVTAVANIFLYTKLPQIVGNHFNMLGIPDSSGGKAIIWVFPLIFLVCAFLFNEAYIDKLSLGWIKNKKIMKICILGGQIILWIAILSPYIYYFSII